MNFYHAIILGVMLAAVLGTAADFAHVGIRRLWRYHQRIRAIRRTRALCRMYGFRAPADDERSSLHQFHQHIKR